MMTKRSADIVIASTGRIVFFLFMLAYTFAGCDAMNGETDNRVSVTMSKLGEDGQTSPLASLSVGIEDAIRLDSSLSLSFDFTGEYLTLGTSLNVFEPSIPEEQFDKFYFVIVYLVEFEDMLPKLQVLTWSPVPESQNRFIGRDIPCGADKRCQGEVRIVLLKNVMHPEIFVPSSDITTEIWSSEGEIMNVETFSPIQHTAEAVMPAFTADSLNLGSVDQEREIHRIILDNHSDDEQVIPVSIFVSQHGAEDFFQGAIPGPVFDDEPLNFLTRDNPFRIPAQDNNPLEIAFTKLSLFAVRLPAEH